jgi:hypothetical protein
LTAPRKLRRLIQEFVLLGKSVIVARLKNCDLVGAAQTVRHPVNTATTMNISGQNCFPFWRRHPPIKFQK